MESAGRACGIAAPLDDLAGDDEPEPVLVLDSQLQALAVPARGMDSTLSELPLR